jgi:hypothetical protein
MTLSLNRVKSACLLLSLLCLMLAIVGCASVPSGTTGPVVSGKILSRADLGVYGGSRSVNPFIAKSALVLGAPDEFVVFELDLTLPQAAHILIDASVTDESGTMVGKLYTPQEMHRYWENTTDVSDHDARTRLETLDRYYAPSFSFDQRGGRFEEILIFVGKNPIPRPATVTVSVTINTDAPQILTFPLPVFKK